MSRVDRFLGTYVVNATGTHNVVPSGSPPPDGATAWTPFSFGAVPTTIFDTMGAFASGNPTRLTAQFRGFHYVLGRVRWEPIQAGSRALALRKNGATVMSGRSIDASNSVAVDFQACSDFLFLDAGDYIELVGAQTSGGNLNNSDGASGRASGTGLCLAYAFHESVRGAPVKSLIAARFLDNVDQTIPNGLTPMTPVIYDGVDFDLGSFRDGAHQTRIVLKRKGYYLLTAAGELTAVNMTGSQRFAFALNGDYTNVIWLDCGTSFNSGDSIITSWVGIVKGSAGDYVEVVLSQDTGVGLVAPGGAAPHDIAASAEYLGS